MSGQPGSAPPGSQFPRPSMQPGPTLPPSNLAPRPAQAPGASAQPNVYQYQQRGQAMHQPGQSLHQQHQQYLQAQNQLAMSQAQQGQYRQQAAQSQPGQPQPGMPVRPQQPARPPAAQYAMHQQQMQHQQQQQQGAAASQMQAVRPAQAPTAPSLQNTQAIARMLQNMPAPDYIARTLGMDQANVEHLMRSNQEGRSYLAQQLVQRGIAPGGGLVQPNGPQLPAGMPGQQMRRPTPPPAVNRPAAPTGVRRPGMPYPPGPQGQPGVPGAVGTPVGGQPGVMMGQQPRPTVAQQRPMYSHQGNFPQPSTSYPANRPAFNPVYPQGIHRPATPPGIPGGQGSAGLGPSQVRPQAGQPSAQPARAATPPPAVLSEGDKKFLNKQALQQLLTRVGGPKLHLKPEAEAALVQVMEDLVGQALSFGCSMAQRRQSAGASAEDLQLQPADLAAFLEHNWQLHVPGFGSNVVRPYKRPAASELHKSRAAAVRRAMAANATASQPQPETA